MVSGAPCSATGVTIMFEPALEIRSKQFAPLTEKPEMHAAYSLLKNSSIELSTNGEAAIKGAAAVLPGNMGVYVPKMPRASLGEKLVQLKLLRKYGLNPIPHIVARQLSSDTELRAFLSYAIVAAGVHRVLVIGGDDAEAAGPFADSAAVIESGILGELGITAVDVAGYPDGHPKIPREVLAADLRRKKELADRQGLELGVVTQFSFDAGSVVRFCGKMAEVAPEVPVYAGLAGPTSPAKLMRFAKICGVSTSMRAANKLGMNAIRLATHSSPEKQFDTLAGGVAARAAGNLKGIHLFSFGGFVDSANWLDNKARSVGLGS